MTAEQLRDVKKKCSGVSKNDHILDYHFGKVVYCEKCLFSKEEVRHLLLEEIKDFQLSPEDWNKRAISIAKTLKSDVAKVGKGDMFWSLHVAMECIVKLEEQGNKLP